MVFTKLLRGEGNFLSELSKNRKIIVEIGSFEGGSTLKLAKNPNCKVYAIDPHLEGSFNKFKQNIRNYKNIVPIIKKSEDAIDDVTEKIDFLFIDGSHKYDDVLKDFILWSPKVRDGGIVAFHDSYNIEDVRKVVIEKLYLSKNFKVGRFRSIAYGIKIKINILDAIANRIKLIHLLIYGIWRVKIRRKISKIYKMFQRMIKND